MVDEQTEPKQSDETDEQRGREDRPKQRLDAFIPDMLRRTFYAGLGAIFTSEEGLRRMAQDFSLPKDAASYLINQAQSTKNELFRIFAAEIRRFLDEMQVNEELQRLLGSMTIEMSAQVRFIPHDEQLRPVVKKSKVRVRRSRKSKRDKAEAREEAKGETVPEQPDESPAEESAE